MKRITTVAALWVGAALQMLGQGLNYNASKSNTGNFVIETGQPFNLQRVSKTGVAMGTIASVPNGIAVAKVGGNYMVSTGSSIVQVTPLGSMTTIANAPSSAAGAPEWVAIAPDQLGNLVAVDNREHAVWLITPGAAAGAAAGASGVKKIASYTVSSAGSAEDAGIDVDINGNYVVLEDNGGAAHVYSITPAGVVSPIQLMGGTPKQASALHKHLNGVKYEEVFVSPLDNSVYELGPIANSTAVVTLIASNVASSGTLTGVAADPDTGNLYVTTSSGEIVEMAIKQVGVPCPCVTSEIGTLAAPPLDIIAETYGDLPHLAAGDVWTTGFYILNTGSWPASYSISFFDNSGNPAAMPLPSGNSAVMQGTLPAQGMTYIEAANPQESLVQGSGLISADPTITVQALFRQSTGGGNYYEAGVSSTAGTSGDVSANQAGGFATPNFVFPFDDTTFPATGQQLYTGFAVASLDPANSASITCVATDPTGATIPNGLTIPTLLPLGHYANYLFPALTGLRGTISCGSTTAVAAIALRFLGPAFSSLPVLY